VEKLGELVEVTLIDRSDAFVFGYTKLDVMVGARTLDQVRLPYRDIAKPGLRFRQESVVSIDPHARRVVTDGGSYEADVLVVALGADYDVAATPGLAEGGYEFYSPEGAARVAEVLQGFDRGAVVISVLGPLFKCPPAPNEAALMLHDLFVQRGVREDVTITLTTPLTSPIPVSPETSQAIEALLAERGIAHWPSSLVSRLDPAAKVAHLADGRMLAYDLFLGVPVHRAPTVVAESALAEDGWIPVDRATFATRFPGVYAIGDVTGKLMLAHTAEAMAMVTAETIAGEETVEIDFDMIPRATYCQPQIASFGYSEAQAKEKGYDVKTAKFPFSANGKAKGLGDTTGFVKIIADAQYNEIIGAAMIGPDVTELLPVLTLAQKWDLTADEVARNVFAHPTLSEAVKEAVHGITGHMINF